MALAFGLAACMPGVRRVWQPRPYGTLINTAPPEAGPGGATLDGYIDGGEWLGFADDASYAQYRIGVAWGTPKPDKRSELLILDDTIVEHGGVLVAAATAEAKCVAIERLTSQGWSYHRVAVSYEATGSNIGISDSTQPGYFLSPVTRIVVDPVK